jgi:hypothetical protein
MLASIAKPTPPLLAAPAREPPADDDELDELPPIDGDVGDSADGTVDLDEMPGPGDENAESDSSLDDSTGEGEPPDLSELEGDEAEDGWVDEAADSPDLDLGEAAIVDLMDLREEDASLEDGEDPPSTDEEFGIEEIPGAGFEAAEDGPLDPDELLRDEDLPAMDADDEGDGEGRADEAGFLDDRFVGDEPLGLPWAAEPWSRVGPSGGLSWAGLTGGVTAIACAPRGALVAGRSESGLYELALIDLEGTRHVLTAHGLDGGRVTAVAVEGDSIAAVADGGRLLLSRDGGARFETLVVTDGVAASEVALRSGVTWIRTRTGSLLVVRPGKAIERCAVPGTLVAIANDAARGLCGLAVDEGGVTGTLLRGAIDGSVSCNAMQMPHGKPASVFAARGEYVAYGSSSPKSAIVRRDPAGGWRRFPWDGPVTAMAFVDDIGTLLAATYSEADDTTGLVRLDAAGRGTVIARVGAARDDADADGRAVAIACDDPRGVVWLAGGFGVAAFAIR